MVLVTFPLKSLSLCWTHSTVYKRTEMDRRWTPGIRGTILTWILYPKYLRIHTDLDSAFQVPRTPPGPLSDPIHFGSILVSPLSPSNLRVLGELMTID